MKSIDQTSQRENLMLTEKNLHREEYYHHNESPRSKEKKEYYNKWYVPVQFWKVERKKDHNEYEMLKHSNNILISS